MEEKDDVNSVITSAGRDTVKEYRIMAYFSEIYLPRSYKRKLFHTRKEAEAMYPEAKAYYSGASYARYLDRVVIESRLVTGWKKD